MKLTCFRSGTTWTMSPRQQRAFPAGPARPMQDRSTIEMTVAANERQTVAERPGFAFPKDDGLVWPHHPLVVSGMEENWHASEGPAPLHHPGVVVRVRDGDGRDAAHRLDCLDKGFRTLPSGVRKNKADGEGRVDTDANESTLLEPDRVPMGYPQVFQGRPLLARDLDVLAVILADGAADRWLIAFGRAASRRRCR
jgi:hypothetical protein